ncbi:multidrug resistance-associated protein 1-like [Planococcus citri]|uniref:multidrug resistance-associated protein 1-like n=1 Tax=Planococcus citri TaxID=170843 RepID=UPI0031F9E6C8
MDKFCGSKFWDWNLTWFTENPKFTPCFEETVLVWIPSSILWASCIIAILSGFQSKARDIPWGWLNIGKLVGIGILLLITFLDAGYAFSWHPSYMKMYAVDYSNAIIRHLNFILVGGMIVLNKKRGLRTSPFMFFFWLSLVICSWPHYITEIKTALYDRESLRVYPYVSNIFYFPMILSMFILELFIDSSPQLLSCPPIKNLPPNTRVSFFNNLFGFWYDSFAFRAFRQSIELKDLWNLENQDRLDYLVPMFSSYWSAAEDENEKKRKQHMVKLREKFNGYQSSVIPYKKIQDPKPVSIIPILWKCFGWTYISATIFKALVDVMMFANPQILNLLIGFEDSNEPLWHGILYAVMLLILGIFQMIFLNNYVFRIFRMGLQMRSTLMAVIYRKALRISNNAKKSFSLGDITNLMSVDAQRFYDVHLYLNMAISAPFTISASLYFLWRTVGWSAFAGLFVMLVIIPINGFAAGRIKSLQTEQMKCKDERVKITNEVLSGIKALKMYAWETSFERKILEIREKEIKLLKSIANINTSVSFLWTSAPFLVSLITFAVFTFADPNNVLTAQIAFVSLSLFNIIKLPISLIPRMITNTVQAMVATKRINKFLNSGELDFDAVEHDTTERDPIITEKGTFTWGTDRDRPTLTNINVRIKSGDLVAIVGPVGCGKSSLLSAFLGEMNKVQGRVNTKGTIAYVPQQAWLQNATVRENILFTNPYKKPLYNKVVDACALRPDFLVLPGGDQTEIGEKGVNLSGGQKQRISLARAVYNNADTYFLDDPLSAVDSHVGKHIFENVIGPHGMLRKKTRLLVTHATNYLSEVDYIIVMKGGCITENGTYNELMKKQGDFSDFIMTYSQEDHTAIRDKEDLPEQTQKYERSLSEEVNYSSLTNIFVSTATEEEPPSTLTGNERLTGDELVNEGNIKLSTYWSYVKSGGVVFWLVAILFNLFYQAASIIANLWLTDWSTDPEINNNEHSFKKYYYLGIYALYGLGQILSILIGTWAMYWATIRSSEYLHNNLLKKVLNWPAYMFDVTPLGRVLNRFSYDIDVIDNTFPFTIRQLLTLGGQMASTIYVIVFSSPLFVVVFIPIAVLYIFIEQIYVAVMRQLKRNEAVSRTPIYSHFSETVTGAHMIRAFGMEELFISESEKRTYLNQVYTYPSVQGMKWVSLRLDNIGNAVIFSAALFAVWERGSINSGLIGLSVSYALQITGALNWVIRTLTDIETNIVSVERIEEFNESPEEPISSEKYRSVPNSWPNEGKIVFDNFKVRYREGLDLVLRGINLNIEGGEKIGIVGRTGAGKSSLTSCLFRTIEAAEGKIFVDDIDIASVDLHTLRSRITIIPQDPVLFSGTLRMNLDPFYEYSDQKLWRALDLAHLKTFVATLPRGLYHIISENGGNVSIGQRQLICLARALLRKTKILILDEATAAIDLETDEILQKTIRSEFKNCTVLTIAHKLNTIMDSDRILLLDNGLVKEFDTPQILLNDRSSAFYGMAKDAGLVV